MATPDDRVTVINLHPIEADCWVCGARHIHRQGVPIYEDVIVPDSYDGEWGGAAVCRRCYFLVRGMQTEISRGITGAEVRTLLRTEDHCAE